MNKLEKFSINEIITIIMNQVKIKENERTYGIEEEEKYPKHIEDKINLMDDKEYQEFINIILEIAEKILEIKTGELNELNKCHEEIIYLAGQYLDKYVH